MNMCELCHYWNRPVVKTRCVKCKWTGDGDISMFKMASKIDLLKRAEEE